MSLVSVVRLLFVWLLVLAIPTLTLRGQTAGTARQSVFKAADEVTTAELASILAANSAIVLDARSANEFAVGHIPGALNVAPRAGVPISMYVSDVAEIERLVKGRKSAPIVLYCNGPHCGKSERLLTELVMAGFTNVRRYQLGLPMWWTMGEVAEVEAEGARYILANDKTSVLIDAREAAEFKKRSLPGARNIPRSLVLDGKDIGEVKKAKDDGRLPMEDHSTRIIVVGSDGPAARYVAEALAREAFHKVAFFAGDPEKLR